MADPEIADCRASRDPCIVATVQLAGLLRSWVDSYEQRMNLRDPRGQVNIGRTNLRDENGFFVGRNPDAALSGVAALSQETLRIGHGEGVHPDKIRAILRVRHASTELRTADLLVTAIERPEAFYDGSLTVSARSRAHQAECCGGSLNGSFT